MATACCSRNAKSWLEAVIEHLVRRQGQPRGAQVHAMFLSDQKSWSQDPPLPRPRLRVGSGGKGILLKIPAYLRPFKGKQLLSFISVPTAVAFEQVLTCCSLEPFCSAVVAVLSIMLCLLMPMSRVVGISFRVIFAAYSTWFTPLPCRVTTGCWAGTSTNF